MEQQLRAEVQTLLARAAAGGADDGRVDLPGELKRREARLARIAEVKIEIERRSAVWDAEERAAYEAKCAQRATKEQARGRKLGGKPPSAPVPGPRLNDQINFTDGESRIMPMAGGGFEQAYNAQATVTMESLRIIGAHVTQHVNDQQEMEPALAELAPLPQTLGAVERMAADNGYFNQHNVEIVVNNGIEPPDRGRSLKPPRSPGRTSGAGTGSPAKP